MKVNKTGYVQNQTGGEKEIPLWEHAVGALEKVHFRALSVENKVGFLL